jgi:hypothetical protein
MIFFAVIFLGGNQEQGNFLLCFLFVYNILFSYLAESLKRHIEKVIKEEVSELRREVKKVRYFAEAWLSSPGMLFIRTINNAFANAVQLNVVFVFRY